MKKTIAVLVLLISGFSGFSQKFGYVDTKFVLERMPGYIAAQKEVDQLSEKWQKELEVMYKGIEQKYNDLRAEEPLLPADVLKQRQDEIFELERKAKEFKKNKFGYEGELFKVQDEKIKPVQDQLYQAIELMVGEKKLDFIFDKSGNSGIIYFNPLYDRTKDIMTRLGVKE